MQSVRERCAHREALRVQEERAESVERAERTFITRIAHERVQRARLEGCDTTLLVLGSVSRG